MLTKGVTINKPGTGVRMMILKRQDGKMSGSHVKDARSDLAALLSIVPGLGHYYKGYRLMGAVVLLLGVPLVFFLAGLLALATVGMSLFLPFLFWAAVMWHAYMLPDHNRHHWFL